MSSKKSTASILIAALLIVAAVFLGWLYSHSSRSIKTQSDERQKSAARILRSRSRVSVVQKNEPGTAAGERLTTNPATEDTFLALEIISSIRARGKELKLSPEEIEKLKYIFLEFQEIKAMFESGIAKIETFDGKTLVATVPPYLVEGRKMRDAFQNRIRVMLPQAYEKIDDYLGGYFDDRFVGFGICDQQFIVTKIDSNGESFVQILRKVTPLPGQTPSGFSTNTRWERSTSSARLSVGQLQTGEYSFLAPLVKRAFFQQK